MFIGVPAVALQHLKQLIRPRLSLVGIGSYEGMHGKNVHFVVVGGVTPGFHPVPEISIVNDMVAANEARQIKGLGGGVDSHGVLFCPVVDHQGGGVLGVGDVRPDLI